MEGLLSMGPIPSSFTVNPLNCLSPHAKLPKIGLIVGFIEEFIT